MTSTCSTCNAGLGSRTESALLDWFDGAFETFYTREGQRKPFGHDRVLYRTAPTGEFVLFHEGARRRGEDDEFTRGGNLVAHQR